jgi:serine/threonine protein kinase
MTSSPPSNVNFIQSGGIHGNAFPLSSSSSLPQKQVRISPKVDVWSAGVLLYQMFYGKKPFGDNMVLFFLLIFYYYLILCKTPQGILASQAILRAFYVDFPNDVYVSPTAKVYPF